MSVDLHWINGTQLVTKRQCRKQFRRSILEAWNWQCAYCGQSVHKAATLDHIVAQVNGGLTVKSNLVACCQSCNGDKGSHAVWDWFRKQPFFSLQREAAIWRWRFMGDSAMPALQALSLPCQDYGLESRA